MKVKAEETLEELRVELGRAEKVSKGARDLAHTVERMNSQPHRVQKCPVCKGQAVSKDTDNPFICNCGWRSDKSNGGDGR